MQKCCRRLQEVAQYGTAPCGSASKKRVNDPQIWAELRAGYTKEKRRAESKKRTERAVRQWQRAAEQAVQGSADVEHFGTQSVGVSTDEHMETTATWFDELQLVSAQRRLYQACCQQCTAGMMFC